MASERGGMRGFIASLLSQWAWVLFLVHSLTLAASRPLWCRQCAHSSFATITDRLCCRDSPLNLSQTVGLCLCEHCGESKHTSIFLTCCLFAPGTQDLPLETILS